jgi:pimeloyl-ACP methyl ester carboxylesterase
VFVRSGGVSGGPVLLLLHGLGGTSEVWDGLIDLLPGHWPGGWIAPDLPGHGRSAPPARYSFGGLAAAVGSAVPVGPPLAVLGHSLGGVVAMALGSGWFGVSPSVVAGLGIKVRWTEEELGKAAELAARPPKVFADRNEAANRALKVAGLSDLQSPDSAFAQAAVAASDGGYRLALDPAAYGAGAPDMEGLLRASRARVVLAAGEQDPMSPAEHLAALVPEPLTLKGLGHNAHAEDPAALLPLVQLLEDALK